MVGYRPGCTEQNKYLPCDPRINVIDDDILKTYLNLSDNDFNGYKTEYLCPDINLGDNPTLESQITAWHQSLTGDPYFQTGAGSLLQADQNDIWSPETPVDIEHCDESSYRYGRTVREIDSRSQDICGELYSNCEYKRTFTW